MEMIFCGYYAPIILCCVILSKMTVQFEMWNKSFLYQINCISIEMLSL